MSFSFWGRWDTLFVDFSVQPGGYVVFALYLAGLAWLLWRERTHLIALSRGQAVFWIACLIFSMFFCNLLVVWPDYLLRRPMPVVDWRPFALIVGLPIVFAGTVGIFPAALTGFMAGLVQAVGVTHSLFAPAELAVWGVITAALLRQAYVGRFPHWLRQPVVAAPLGAVVMWIAFWPSYLFYRGGNVLFSLLRGWPMLQPLLWLILLDAVGIGVVVQLALFALPSLRPVRQTTGTPPYSRSLKAEVLFLFVPLMVLFMVALFAAVNVTAVRVAIDQSVAAAVRDARVASRRIPFMMWTGQELLSQVAQDSELWDSSGQIHRERLERSVRSSGLFKEILLVDRGLQLIDSYPPPPLGGHIDLEPVEQFSAERVLRSGAFLTSPVFQQANGQFALSFLAPILRDGDMVVGILIGRADMRQGPMIHDALSALQQTMEAGVGFIVDERSLIIAHPDEKMILMPWTPNPHPDEVLEAPGGGTAYLETGADGSRWLVYSTAVEGSPWKTVIRIPYERILLSAATISTSFTIVLLFVGLALGALVTILSVRFTRPIEALSQAAVRISQGDLDVPVTVRGDTEVGRLGNAFEGMRLSLQKRLKELGLLLNISRAVSANLELERNLEPILVGAMQATHAVAAHIVILGGPDDRPDREVIMQRFGRPTWRRIRAISAPLARLIQGRRPIKVADTSIYPDVFSAAASTALGFPLLVKNRLVGALLVEYDGGNELGSTEREFLHTLAGQAAVVIESSRLFEAVESERQRLKAILASTQDAILVTDRDNTLLLLNPAAEATFGLSFADAYGKPVGELALEPTLTELLTRSPADLLPQTKEVALSPRRTLYASVAPVVGEEGETLGRVAVLRDITHLKELDKMKTDFVTNVSHDLRGPLTALTGYTTLIQESGPLTDRQREFLEKMRNVIRQMTELITNLLNISRLEAGIDISMTQEHIDRLIQSIIVDFKPRAKEKGIDLRAELAEGLPAITMDPTLIRQAISNLIDNALKYTPSGFVRVLALREGDAVVVKVQDSGLGIPAEAQGRLFEKFYRVRSRETQKIHGSGLGLAIVKSIVELHRGRVWVESELGKGSCFYMALPIAKTQTNAEGISAAEMSRRR